MTLPRALLGIAILIGLAWLLSWDRKRIPWRTVIGGILLQVVVVFTIAKTETGQAFFSGAARFVSKLVSMAVPGAEMVFGGLARPSETMGFVFAFAGTGLVLIIFISALMSVLYHLGVMQILVWALAKVMSRTMGLSGGEAMAAAANIFMGQTEAPLVVKPYLPVMTKSEIHALMVGGFATIAGSVMAVYMSVLGPELAPHLITASVMSAPASFVIAKIVLPEREVSVTSGDIALRFDKQAGNLIEAAANGTTEGLRLWLNVIAMLIAFVALVALVNWPLQALGEALSLDGGLSLQRIFGWIFAPIAWVIGVSGWHDCQIIGGLLGTQISLNEFVAFQGLAQTMNATDPALMLQDPRSAKIAAYALCGFANFSSIGIQLGGISALIPERKGELSKIAFRAMLGGALACWMTATVAAAFL